MSNVTPADGGGEPGKVSHHPESQSAPLHAGRSLTLRPLPMGLEIASDLKLEWKGAKDSDENPWAFGADGICGVDCIEIDTHEPSGWIRLCCELDRPERENLLGLRLLINLSAAHAPTSEISMMLAETDKKTGRRDGISSTFTKLKFTSGNWYEVRGVFACAMPGKGKRIDAMLNLPKQCRVILAAVDCGWMDAELSETRREALKNYQAERIFGPTAEKIEETAVRLAAGPGTFAADVRVAGLTARGWALPTVTGGDLVATFNDTVLDVPLNDEVQVADGVLVPRGFSVALPDLARKGAQDVGFAFRDGIDRPIAVVSVPLMLRHLAAQDGSDQAGFHMTDQLFYRDDTSGGPAGSRKAMASAQEPAHFFPQTLLLFDAAWYRKTYGLDPSMDDAALFEHYKAEGEKNRFQPSPYFAPAFVRAQFARNGIAVEGDLFSAYREHCDRVDPHVLLPRDPIAFSTSLDMSIESGNDWFNFSVYVLHRFDSQKTRHSLFFDPSYVTDENGAPADRPLETYLRDGYLENKRVSALFDPDFYRSMYPGVERSIGRNSSNANTLLEHFLQQGIYEGKIPIADFDADHYAANNPEIGESMSPVEHFLKHGIREGRNPNPYFDTAYYMQTQPDVARSVIRNQLAGPFEHFLKIGYKAGYKASQPLYECRVPERFGKAAYEKRCRLSATSRLRSGEPLEFPENTEPPQVSCIIPVVDQGHMTLHLLEQLAGIAWRRDTPSIEVIVVDNGSTDITRQLADHVTNITCLRSDEPLGYPKACNTGAAVAKGDVLLFMNNDIEVNADAFRYGFRGLAERPEVGALGGRIVLMTGELQEAGSVLFDDGGAQGIGRMDDPTLPKYAGPREVDYCSGCFLFVRRRDFEAVGGLDEMFSPGYYEEADLCFRLKERGLISMYDPRIFIHHYEYASYSKGRPPSASATLMQRNRKLFTKRHRERLASSPLREDQNWPSSLMAGRRTQARNIALIEDAVPDAALGSGFVRSADIIETLLAEGHNVTVFALNYLPGASGFADKLRLRGVEVVECYHPDAPKNFFEGREWDFDVIWICRTHNFLKCTEKARRVRASNPNVKIVLDTEAIVALRRAAYRRLRHGNANGKLGRDVAEELTSALQPVAILAVNRIDRENVERQGIARTLELGHRMNVSSDPPGPDHRKGLLFFGAFHDVDSPNYDSIQWFLEAVWPEILKQRPGERLRIAGHCSEDVPLGDLVATAPGVEFLGRLDDLQPLIDEARCFVAPTRYAGGVPHKVHSAMSSGLPVVCTDLLREQLETGEATMDDVPVLSAGVDDPVEFARQCVKILSDDETWRKTQKAALDFVSETASDRIFGESIRKVLDAIA